VCIAFVVALTLTACGELKVLPTEPGPNPPDPNATFTRVQQEILTPTCTANGCHGKLGTQSELLLTADASYTNLVNRPSVEINSLMRVKPLDDSNSYIVRKLEGVNIVGDRMPQGGPYLSSTQIKLVRDWIRRGAPND
jgi:hypothetical protein